MVGKLYASSSPHLRQGDTTRKIMLDVIIALLPACIASVVIFGYMSAVLIAVSVVSCVICEYICRKIMKRNNTIGDLSAVVTGILLALNYPVSLSPLIAIGGSVVAIVIVKQMFGGIGQNFVNPALTARIVLLTSFSSKMSNWTEPFAYLNKNAADAVSTATPLADSEHLTSYFDLFFGIHGGCLGETCVLAILLGGIYLVARRVITPLIPLTYMGTVAILSLCFGLDPIYQLLSGGLMLGAVFIATDYTTTPLSNLGRFVFAVGCGLLTMLIRQFGSLPEGVSFSIVIMNILVPYIEKFTRLKPKGFIKPKKESDSK